MLAKRFGLPRVRGAEGFLFAVLIDSLGTGLFLPFSLLYFHVAVGLPLVTVGLALSLATIFTLPIAPLTGILVDRFDARRVVILSQLLQGCGFLGYLLVTNAATLVGFALLSVIGQRMFWSAYFTLVAEIALPGEQDRWFGLAGAAQNAGIGLGGLLAGLLVATNGILGYHIVVAANALSFFLAATLLLLFLRLPYRQVATNTERSGYRVVSQDRPFLVMTINNIVFALGSMMLAIGLPIYITTALNAPVWSIGALLALNTVLLASTQTIVVRWLEPYRRTRSIALAGSLWCVWCILFALAVIVPRSLLLPYLFGITCVYSLAELVHAPTSTALASAASQEHLRGRYLALFQLAWSVASILAPGLFTLLFTITPMLPWLALAVLMLLASTVIYCLERYLPKHSIRAERTSSSLAANSAFKQE